MSSAGRVMTRPGPAREPAAGRTRTTALLLRQARRFMGAAAEELARLRDSGRALRRELQQTPEYHWAVALCNACALQCVKATLMDMSPTCRHTPPRATPRG